MPTPPKDKQVLADPGAFTVEQVLEAFGRAEIGQIADAKAIEGSDTGKKRAGVLEYSPPPPPPEEPRLDRDRVLNPTEGPVFVGTIEQLGRAVTYPDIVGALEGDEADEYTAAEVAAKVIDFLGRPHDSKAA